ncbi:E3 ubiquitin-protein ligase TRIM21-like [Sparus aurata]|uniref:E3 ubiquitin-protein ligase TRIM21-like n=1 Tax=Sparus aurata TaxID=8175 RepID=UPI0011C1763B|nr:E3 ubiquitin-protein ligase TRIM21-like [Sparus aurata]
MSAASCLLTEDQFLCSICLDVFTDPVAIPCGHNFCKTCITKHWDKNDTCQCPNCKKTFNTRPELQVNMFISEMAAQFRQSAQQKASSNHKTHDVVPLKERYEGKKAKLGKRDAEIQQMIQKRRLKIEEMKRSVELSKKDADREIAAGVQVFSALKESVERSQAELIDTIKEKQRETEKQAEGFIKELEQEISELEERSSEVKKISSSKQKLFKLFRRFPSLNDAPPTKDWTGVSVRPPSYEGTVVRAVNQLEETLSKQMKNLFEAELKRVQQYAVDVTLDPDVVHPRSSGSHQTDYCRCVISKKCFTSGKFYFAFPVNTSSTWTLGVTIRESINRKGHITLSPQNGYWTICLRNKNEYKACAGPSVRLSLKSRPEKVGVFVDYEEGLVSFYDVDAAALIYSFTGCCFTQKLYPFFSPCPNDDGKNSAPVIISPVNVNIRRAVS